MVLRKEQLVGVGHQGVPGDAGDRLVGLGDAPVDDEHLPPGLHRGFPLPDLHRDVAVDDPGPLAVDAELRQDLHGHLRVVAELVVDVLGLGPGGLVVDKVPLKGSHLVFAVQGGLRAAPQEPHEVQPLALLLAAAGAVRPLAAEFVAVVHQRLAPVGAAVDLEGSKAAVGGHGDAAVVEKVAVADLVHPPVLKEEVHVGLEFFAVEEGELEPLHQFLLGVGEGIGGLRGDGGEVAVVHGVLPAVHRDGAAAEVDLVQ